MEDKHSQDKLNALRQRLYERGDGPKKRENSVLTDEKIDVPTSWKRPTSRETPAPAPAPAPTPTPIPDQAPAARTVASSAGLSDESIPDMSQKKKKKKYRLKLLLAGMFFFIASVGVSSLYIAFGNQSISGDNIAINLTGPFTIGGGEIIPLQVGITNQNNVPIESATLVVEYPLGTQSADEDGRELFTERLPLDSIGSGETINLPLRAQVFGEENSEQIVNAAVEYRVKGSNATFYKEAEPLRFKISSSPVVVSVDAVKAVSSNQQTDIKITVKSNAPTILSDILVRAEYPEGFDYSKSNPTTISGQNVWTIDKLAPEESKTITITGQFIGSESESKVMNFSVGVPNERDKLNLASVFSVSSAEFTIEQAFLDVGIVVNGVRNSTSAIAQGAQSSVSVMLENILQDSIYDAVVELKLSGNALSDAQVSVNSGYYDSNTQTITWDASSAPQLETIIPGAKESFSFSLIPNAGSLLTPQIDISAAVSARRVSESRAQEEIVGTVKSSIKVESGVSLAGSTGYNTGPFNDSGDIPPTVGKTTTYTIELVAGNGSNNIASTIVTATLPSYVNWLDKTAGIGTFEYNPSTRVVEWKAGSLSASAESKGFFQVSILPSSSQIGKTPTLVSDLRLKAEDNFTGTPVRATASALTTEIPESSGYERGNGSIQSN